jgi:hypothetical protein
MPKRQKFVKLLKRRGLSQERFTELVENAWTTISGRKLSRQAVSAWVNGHAVPQFSPAEILVILEILECTLTELALAFPHDHDSQS